MGGTFLKVFAFVLLVVGVYAYVGQLIPQFEEHPPKKRTIAPATAPADLVAIGEELLHGKGGCLICHKITEKGNDRGPDLRQAAAKAPTRRPGMTAAAYLLESILQPGAYLVPGYPNIMPPATKPPANLTVAEVKAIVAYLQALGGATPSVAIEAEDLAPERVAAGPTPRGRALFESHGCVACHALAGEGGTLGPDLATVATRRSAAELMQKIANPRAWTTPGYEAGIMPADLASQIPERDRREIVAYLVGLAGKKPETPALAALWSYEGVRLGVVVFLFNAGLLLTLALARRRERRGERP